MDHSESTGFSFVAAVLSLHFGSILQCVKSGFAGTHSDNILDVADKDLAVADVSGVNSLYSCIYYCLDRNLRIFGRRFISTSTPR